MTENKRLASDRTEKFIRVPYTILSGMLLFLVACQPVERTVSPESLKPPPEIVSTSGSATIIVDEAPLRASPYDDAPSAVSLNDGTRVNILEKTADNIWYLVSAPDAGEGWVRTAFIEILPEEVIENAPTEQGIQSAASGEITITQTSTSVSSNLVTEQTTTPTLEVESIVIAMVSINIRSGPGNQYHVVGNMLVDQEAPIIGRAEGLSWWKIQCPDETQVEECWVTSLDRYTTAQNPESVSFVEPPPTPLPTRIPPTYTPRPKPPKDRDQNPEPCTYGCSSTSIVSQGKYSLLLDSGWLGLSLFLGSIAVFADLYSSNRKNRKRDE